MTIDTEITWNRLNHDYDCFVDDRYIGSRPTYIQGDTLVNQVKRDLIEDGLTLTAAELDADPEPIDPLPEQPGDQYPGVDYEEERAAIRNVAQYVREYTTVTRYANGRGRSRTYAADVDTIADTARQLAEMVEALLDSQGVAQ